MFNIPRGYPPFEQSACKTNGVSCSECDGNESRELRVDLRVACVTGKRADSFVSACVPEIKVERDVYNLVRVSHDERPWERGRVVCSVRDGSNVRELQLVVAYVTEVKVESSACDCHHFPDLWAYGLLFPRGRRLACSVLLFGKVELFIVQQARLRSKTSSKVVEG